MRRRLAPAGLAAVALAGMLLFRRLLETAPDFDEGVYLLSLEALRAGEALGGDVFAAQPPGFYALLRLAGATVGTGLEDVRLGVVLCFAVGAAGAWAFARPLAGGWWALLPAALLAIAPPVPLFGARVLADLPALWLAVAAVGLAATSGGRRAVDKVPDTFSTVAWAASAGVVLGAAVSVKLVALLSAPVVLGLLVSRRDRRPVAAAVAGAALVPGVLLAVNARALPELWDTVIRYHTAASDTPAVVDRSEELAELFNLRVPFTWLVVTALVVLAWRLLRREATRAELLAWGWAAASGLFLLWHAPLHYNHLVYLPVPLALAAGTTLAAAAAARRGRELQAAAALLLLAVTAGYAQQWRRVAEDRVPEEPGIAAAARELERRTQPGDVVVSDVPAVARLAGRRVPGPLVDTARLRFETGFLTDAAVLETIDDRCVPAVVTGRSFLERPAIAAGLRSRFAERVVIGGTTLYFAPRKRC